MQGIRSSEKVGLLKFFIERITWKLIAQLAVTGVLSGLLFMVWESRSSLSSAALSHWGQPEIKPLRLPAAVEGLAEELHPTSILIWSANVAGDTRRPMFVWINGVRRPELEGQVEPLFPDALDSMGNLVQLLRGEEICVDHTPWAPVGHALIAAGVQWVCATSIPPGMGAVVGAISVGFQERRAGESTRIRSSLRRWAAFVIGSRY